MKKALLICFLVIGWCSVFAQSVPQFSGVMLKKGKDYKLAEPTVLQTADFVLASPIDQHTDSKTAAAQFLMKWMDGTPDYTFTLDENSTRGFLQNDGLMMVYVASMSKYAIQNKLHDSKHITLNAVKSLLAYINNPENKVAQTAELKQLSQANEEGKLESFLNL